jgi:hypothetical protein
MIVIMTGRWANPKTNDIAYIPTTGSEIMDAESDAGKDKVKDAVTPKEQFNVETTNGRV